MTDELTDKSNDIQTWRFKGTYASNKSNNPIDADYIAGVTDLHYNDGVREEVEDLRNSVAAIIAISNELSARSLLIFV